MCALTKDYPNAGQASPIGTPFLGSGGPGGRVLSAFISSLRTADLRRKILFTLAMVILYRAGATLPSPGVNYGNVQQCINEVSGGAGAQIYSLINLFSGGALLQLSVFAVGVMPYITASIIVQLLTVVIPRFEGLLRQLSPVRLSASALPSGRRKQRWMYSWLMRSLACSQMKSTLMHERPNLDCHSVSR